MRVVPDHDPARIQRVLNKETDIIWMDMGEMGFYYTGVGPYADLAKANLYTLWTESDPIMGMAVRGNSEFETVYDVKTAVEEGEKVRLGIYAPAAGWAARIAKGLPAFLGMDPEDFEIVPFGSVRAMYYSLPEGKSDIIIPGMTSGGLTMELKATPQGLRFLDLPADDSEGWSRLLDAIPTEWPAQTVNWGPQKDVYGQVGMGAPSMHFVHAEMEEELVYQLAKWFGDSWDTYKDTTDQAKRMSIDNFRSYLDVCPVPVHPGTVRYLQEIGKWSAADDTWNEAAKTLMQRYVDAWPQAVDEADANNITIAVDNQEWLDLWAGYVKDIPRLKTRY